MKTETNSWEHMTKVLNLQEKIIVTQLQNTSQFLQGINKAGFQFLKSNIVLTANREEERISGLVPYIHAQSSKWTDAQKNEIPTPPANNPPPSAAASWDPPDRCR